MLRTVLQGEPKGQDLDSNTQTFDEIKVSVTVDSGVIRKASGAAVP